MASACHRAGVEDGRQDHIDLQILNYLLPAPFWTSLGRLFAQLLMKKWVGPDRQSAVLLSITGNLCQVFLLILVQSSSWIQATASTGVAWESILQSFSPITCKIILVIYHLFWLWRFLTFVNLLYQELVVTVTIPQICSPHYSICRISFQTMVQGSVTML